MKKLSTISLFVFGVVVTAILVAGLVFYQNNQNKNQNNQNSVAGQLINVAPGTILNMSEISKHNKQNNCWLLISGKVYDITSFFGSHPGGNGTMAATCGTDATNAYNTQDPYANGSTGGSSHSSNAKNLLDKYYVGDFNQTILINNQKKINGNTPNTSINKDPQSSQAQTANIVPKQVAKPVPPSNVILSLSELAKHNNQRDCWLLINGKVYDITSFFGSHPGGNGTMAATCGTDATAAYMTKDPNASVSGGGSAHSSRAVSLLVNYYIGNLNQNVTTNTIQTVKTTPVTNNNGTGGEDDD